MTSQLGRPAALRERTDREIGFHAHNNLSLAVANSLAAVEEGATQIDGCTRGLGAGAGNCPSEILVAVCAKLGIHTGIDPLKIMDVAEDVVGPIPPRPQVIDRSALLLGYAGVYSSFLLHAERGRALRGGRQGAPDRAGERKVVGAGGHDHRRRAGTGRPPRHDAMTAPR